MRHKKKKTIFISQHKIRNKSKSILSPARFVRENFRVMKVYHMAHKKESCDFSEKKRDDNNGVNQCFHLKPQEFAFPILEQQFSGNFFLFLLSKLRKLFICCDPEHLLSQRFNNSKFLFSPAFPSATRPPNLTHITVEIVFESFRIRLDG
jgi:hypothetical protein